MKDQYYRIRKKQRPNLPKSIEDVDISSYAELTNTERGHPFYRGKTELGIELFMSDKQMEVASQATSLFVDGTFATCPEPFFQTVVLRAKVGENRYTIGTAFLPNKQEQWVAV